MRMGRHGGMEEDGESAQGHRRNRGVTSGLAQGHCGVMRGQGSHLRVTMRMGSGGTGGGDSGHEEVTTGTGRGQEGLGVNSRYKDVIRGPWR